MHPQNSHFQSWHKSSTLNSLLLCMFLHRLQFLISWQGPYMTNVIQIYFLNWNLCLMMKKWNTHYCTMMSIRQQHMVLTYLTWYTCNSQNSIYMQMSRLFSIWGLWTPDITVFFHLLCHIFCLCYAKLSYSTKLRCDESRVLHKTQWWLHTLRLR